MASDIVLITSGTGTVGTELVSRLARHSPSLTVRCGTRNPHSVSSKTLRLLSPHVSPSNVEESNVVPVEFDSSKPETMKVALEGVTKVYLLPPFIEQMEKWHEDVMNAVVQAKSVKYVVKHSVMGARAPTPDSVPGPLPLMHWKGPPKNSFELSTHRLRNASAATTHLIFYLLIPLDVIFRRRHHPVQILLEMLMIFCRKRNVFYRKSSTFRVKFAFMDTTAIRQFHQHYHPLTVLGEEIVRKSGIPFTTIRPTIFAQHFTAFPFVHENFSDTFYMPTEEGKPWYIMIDHVGKIAFLDARDIAELASHLLTLPDPSPHYGQAYHLTGPKAISCSEVATIWTNVTGREIKHEGNREICVERIKRLQPDPFSAKSVETVYRKNYQHLH